MHEAQAERKEDLREFQNEQIEHDIEAHEETGDPAPVETVESWEPSDPQPSTESQDISDDEEDEFDPSEHTVDEVNAYIEDHPDEIDSIREAEIAGKNRVTLEDSLAPSKS